MKRKPIVLLLAAWFAAGATFAAGRDDASGARLTGRVTTVAGEPLAGVVVSDGVRVVRTAADGTYVLPSDKELGYVFVSLPSGYTAPVDDCAIPRFFARTRLPAGEAEVHDFALVPVDDRRYAILAATDHHLADRASDDVAQFTADGGLLAELKDFVAASSVPVYSICMGDMSWDEYWYRQRFALADFRRLYARCGFSCPVFHAIGNHDNDPYCTSDWEASEPFRREIGPTYYSFDLGELHYVVLDNIVYRNTGGGPGVVGRLDYDVRIDDRQLEWLRADLAAVADRTAPLVVVMHAPLFEWRCAGGAVEWHYAFSREEDAARLVDLLSGFEEVHLLTGHTHKNNNFRRGNLFEHNVAATSGTWWWTGKINDDYSVDVCLDGSPGGYEVLEVDGRDIRWYYKGIGCSRDCQFRAYDMNEVLRNERIAASGDFTASGTERGIDDAYGADDVLVNIWGWQPDWQVRVTEAGRELEGVRVVGKDPLHKIAYTRATVPFQTPYNAHMWRYRASSATSALRIEVTDSFGCTYVEEMKRPKPFHVRMR